MSKSCANDDSERATICSLFAPSSSPVVVSVTAWLVVPTASGGIALPPPGWFAAVHPVARTKLLKRSFLIAVCPRVSTRRGLHSHLSTRANGGCPLNG